VKKSILFFLGCAFGTVLFLFIPYFLVGGDVVEQSIMNAHGYVFKPPGDHKLPVEDAVQIKSLIEKGYVLNTGDLISDISNLYTSIIEFLIVIIGILGFVAFMYVRAGSETVAEEKANDAVRRYFKSQDFYRLLQDNVHESTKELKETLKSDLQVIEENVETVLQHENRLEAIEEKVSLSDHEEMEGSEVHLTTHAEEEG
jgi:hypothetical protein